MANPTIVAQHGQDNAPSLSEHAPRIPHGRPHAASGVSHRSALSGRTTDTGQESTPRARQGEDDRAATVRADDLLLRKALARRLACPIADASKDVLPHRLPPMAFVAERLEVLSMVRSAVRQGKDMVHFRGRS